MFKTYSNIHYIQVTLKLKYFLNNYVFLYKLFWCIITPPSLTVTEKSSFIMYVLIVCSICYDYVLMFNVVNKSFNIK